MKQGPGAEASGNLELEVRVTEVYLKVARARVGRGAWLPGQGVSGSLEWKGPQKRWLKTLLGTVGEAALPHSNPTLLSGEVADSVQLTKTFCALFQTCTLLVVYTRNQIGPSLNQSLHKT